MLLLDYWMEERVSSGWERLCRDLKELRACLAIDAFWGIYIYIISCKEPMTRNAK
jgi:hypothetical protein